jgi:hypothetical protein
MGKIYNFKILFSNKIKNIIKIKKPSQAGDPSVGRGFGKVIKFKNLKYIFILILRFLQIRGREKAVRV